MPAAPHAPEAFGVSAGNLAAHLVRQASSRPKADALFVPLAQDGSVLRLDFAELDRETARWAYRLSKAGLRRGDRCLVLVRPGLPLIAVSFALFRLGVVPVLMDPGMGLKSFLACVQRTQPEALVAIPLGHLVSRLFFPKFRSLRCRVRVPGRLDARLAADAPVLEDLATLQPDDTAAILFTSGSTGMPKGVTYRHRHFEAQIAAVRSAYDIRPGEVDMTLLPIFALFNPALGMATVVPEIDPRRPAQLDPARIVRAIRAHGVSNSFGAPPLWKRIATWCEAHGEQLTSMRRILLAGAPVPPPLVKRLRALLPQGEIHTPYGATESLPLTSASGSDILAWVQAGTQRPGSGVCVGRPLPGIQLAVVRPAEGSLRTPSPCRQGEAGELLCSGPVVTDSYDRLPEQTAAAKVTWAPESGQNPLTWHRMGDICRIDAEGRVWFLGRKAERVHLADSILDTEEIEPVFNQHDRVERCALIGFKSAAISEAALVVEPIAGAMPRTDSERTVFANELARLALPGLASSKVTRVFFSRKLPVDVRHNAKIHRLTLARQASEGKLGEPVPFGRAS